VVEQNDRNSGIINEFRANAGKVGGYFEGKTLLLLHTFVAKTGRERVNPLAYVMDGECYVVIASKGGAPENPDWYYNLLATPHVKVEVESREIYVKAVLTKEPERTRLYEKMVAMMPSFAEYRQKTTRLIPVFILEPI